MKPGGNKRKLNSTDVSGAHLIFVINIDIGIGVNRLPSFGVNRNKIVYLILKCESMFVD
jgi:hypothetical protein